MPLTIAYLLKLSISLSLVYLFYQTLLRRLTFYHWNRWYLMGYSLLSFFIPFFNISPLVEAKKMGEVKLIQYIPVVTNYTGATSNTSTSAPIHSFDKWDIMFFLLLTGIFFFTVRLIIQLVSLRRLRKKSTLINDAGTPIYHVDKNIIPFSFGNAIYVNQQLHTSRELEEIILHEYVHVQQKHSIDIILMELVCILNWFNPFAWLLRHAVRQNLEFIADDDVLKTGMDKKAYQYHLLQVVGLPQYRIANSFNLSSLKKRIAMMNKFRSAKIHLIKFLFVLPLIAVLLISFRDKYEHIFKSANKEFVINKVGIVIDGANNHPLEGVKVTDSISGSSTVTNKDGYYAFKINIKAEKGVILLKFLKDSYENNSIENEFSIAELKTHGQIDIVHMVPQKISIAPVMDMPYFGDIPDQPTYTDALVVLKSTSQINYDLDIYNQLEQNHPEVSMFYTTEDKRKHIVIYQNGQVEKYGYPYGPTVSEMENKFGKLPNMWTDTTVGVGGKEYLKKWEPISLAAAKDFHTTNTDVYAIIFPGDSRVIAVPKNSKPRFYDMDNAAPEERPAFEELYGKLPSVVPPPFNNTSFIKSDTIPSSKKIVKDLNDTSKLDFKKVLVLIDNKEVPKGIDWATLINPTAIKSMLVYKGKSALEKYGQKGKDGVISITTKNNDEFALSYQGYQIKEGYRSDSIPVNTDASQNDLLKTPRLTVVGVPSENPPLYFINDKEVKSIKELDPSQIESINVLKDSMAVKKYGEKGRNGVILIKTKLNGNKAVSNDTLPKAINANQKGKHNLTVNDIVVIAPDQPSPLYFIDGKEVKSNEVIYPNQIKSMNVLEGSTAIKQYGERGRNGVILMGTKEPNANSFSQSDKWNQQNKSNEIANVGHSVKRQPLVLFGNNKGENDPVLFIADTISYHNTNLKLSGSITIYDSVTAIIKGNFFFARNGDTPFVVFNGKKLNRIDNFKAVNGRYKIIRLNKELAMAKYGDSSAGNEAFEISSL